MYQTERYHKQMLLKEIGLAGQQRLSNARVLVVGAGGLGCPALLYLAAAGVGTIGIIDFDVVDISNLHRQILYQVEDAGQPKVIVAAKRLSAMNPEIRIEMLQTAIKTENALEIFERYDVIIDGSDNFPTRYLVNDACILSGKPLVYGSVFRFEGQVAVFNVEVDSVKTSYRDLFPEPPDPAEVADCNEAGVLGVVTGIIGSMQAGEAIKIITGAGNPLYNRLVTYNSLTNAMYELEIVPNPAASLHAPGSIAEFHQMDYSWFCEGSAPSYADIDGQALDELILTSAPTLIDVRQPEERPLIEDVSILRIPLAELEKNLYRIDKNKPVVLLCQSGIRSISAARLIAEKLHHREIYNLKGGITRWKKKN